MTEVLITIDSPVVESSYTCQECGGTFTMDSEALLAMTDPSEARALVCDACYETIIARVRRYLGR